MARKSAGGKSARLSLRKSARKAAKKSGAKVSAKARTRSTGAGDTDADASVAELVGDLRREIWPDERQVLFKPDRLKYVRKLLKPEGCVFCNAVAAGVGPESLLLYKGKDAVVIMNKYPYNTGHLLVLPRRHCGDFLEIGVPEHRAMSETLRRCVQALTEAYKPAGFNVGLNLGAAAGAGIPEHLHYHVIPRWAGDTNFFPLIAETKVVVETLEATFARLLPFFA